MDIFKDEVRYLKKMVGRDFENCFLAGGAITSTLSGKKVRDLDLYFKDKQSFCDALQSMFDDGAWCVSITKRAVTFIENNETVYQLMCFDWFETAEDIFSKFDFTVCMAAIDLKKDKLERHPDFIRDLAKRNIRFNHKTEFPLGSAMRVKKYKDRGYEIDNSELLKVILSCSFNKIKDWEDLKNQIGGQYGEAVIMDTSKEFTLDNAINSLTEAIEKPLPELGNDVYIKNAASSYKEAVEIIFGEVVQTKLEELIFQVV